MGTPLMETPEVRSKTLGVKVLDLLQYIMGLPDAPETQLHIILSTYNTWVYRTADFGIDSFWRICMC